MKNLTFKQLRALKSAARIGSVTAAYGELADTPSDFTNSATRAAVPTR